MKTVLFVPGHTENINSRNYKKVIKAIKNKGYQVEFIPINWRYTQIDKWINELDKTYSKLNSKNTILAGFSFGAVTALVAASKRNPAGLWLFSLSPYFAEDIPKVKDSWKKSIGIRKINALSRFQFSGLAPSIKCKSLIFLGTGEIKKYPISQHRAEEASKLLNNSKLIYVNGVDHDVSDERYIAAIEDEI